jgi:hypothetical protein
METTEQCTYYAPCGGLTCQACILPDTIGSWSSLGPTVHDEYLDLAPFGESRRSRVLTRGEPPGTRSQSCGNRRLDQARDMRSRPCLLPADPARPLLRPDRPSRFLPWKCRQPLSTGLFGDWLTDGTTVSETTCASVEPLFVKGGGVGECAFKGAEVKGKALRTLNEVRKKRRKGTRKIDVLKRVERRDSVLSLPSGSKLDAVLDNEAKQTTTNRSDNKFACLGSEEVGCTRSRKMMGQAVAVVKFFSEELGVEADLQKLPISIKCGGFRAAVRGCFGELSVLEELSIKTSQKVEKSCCDNCAPNFIQKEVDWMKNMKKKVEVDEGHLERYSKLFESNVPKGWNTRKYPYVPNGHATDSHPRTTGGNWNREEFSELSHFTQVFSAGKPRIVTCYSSYNSEVLYPLHRSLYHYLEKRKWLLVGEPTEGQVENLNGTGQFLSFDYIGATDNIKVQYVRRGIEILIKQAVGLSEEEKRCLRVLGDLRLMKRHPHGPDYFEKYWGGDESLYREHCQDFFRGQPMGSFMSFPLLCLTNKTIVDLSLTDMLENKEITFKEWSAHRCLVNGDDLLLREPGKKSNLRDRIIYNGGQVGMETNKEKCLESYRMAEVNSTLFTDGRKEKKTNAKSLYPEKMTEDFLSMAYESCRTIKGFLRCVRNNAQLIARQKEKFLWKLPFPYQAACRKDKKIKKALGMIPLDHYDEVDNYFGVTRKPRGYDLRPEEEREIIRKRVDHIRDGVAFIRKHMTNMRWKDETRRNPTQDPNGDRTEEISLGKIPKREQKKIRVAPGGRSWRSLIRRKKPSNEEFVLTCCAEYFYEEQQWLSGEDGLGTPPHELIKAKEGKSLISTFEEILKKPKPTLVSSLPSLLPNFSLQQHQEIQRRIEGQYIVPNERRYYGRRGK